jgi:two-component system CheB/CheR fusion protein
MTKKEQEEEGKQNGRQKPSFVVGIGASAGGLKALESFFTHMRSDSGIAFVVV